MRDGAAQKGHFQHAGPGDVADKAAEAVQEARVLLAPERRADAQGRGNEAAPRQYQFPLHGALPPWPLARKMARFTRG